MADKELLEILSQGIDVWNKWMKDHPDIGVDFDLGNFKEADFSGIDLSEIYLDGSNFRSAKLVLLMQISPGLI